MSFKIKMKKLDPELFVGRRQRRPDGAGVRASAIERQRNRDGRQCKDASFCTQDQLVEHNPNDEEQRIQQLYRRIKFHLLFKQEGCFYWLKQMRQLTACELLKPLTLLTHASNQLFLWQSGQHAKRVNSPQGEGLRLSLAEMENSQRQRRQC